MNVEQIAVNILSLTYLGNVQWFAKLLEGAVIDVGEHYVKQSYRNRCEILAAGGPMALTVNVAAGAQRLAVKDVRIDYSKRWQHVHLCALRSAYGRAPFFEHYWPGLEPVLGKPHRFLYDLNGELLATVLRFMKSDAAPVFSESYVEGGARDFRDTISPKPRLARPDPGFNPVSYWQLKEGFVPNLSIVDLLFSEGPEAADVVRRSARDL